MSMVNFAQGSRSSVQSASPLFIFVVQFQKGKYLQVVVVGEADKVGQLPLS